jgi:lysyl endopeptidase
MSGKLGISILLLTLTAATSRAQLESSTGKISGMEVETWYDISLDSSMLASLSKFVPAKNEGFQFAVPVPVNLTPGNSGCLYNKGNEQVWIVGIRSKSAKSLNVILEPFQIPEGAYVYIYNSERTVIRGAFGSDNNNSSRVLPTMPVAGGELILEYHIPAGIDPEGTIGISQVSHDYLGLFGRDSKDGRYNISQPCNVDINCPAGVAYEKEKRAVCRIIVRGAELCSGVLLNNTNQQNRPFVLTAHHCISDSNDASKSIFVFGYESPWCDGPDGRILHSIAGSLLQSTNTDIDFSLAELSSFPPFTYKPYLAGWDVTGTVPLKTAAIHHPEGDVKKLSLDLNSPVISTFTGLYANGFWKILQWDSGTTEAGSSGSPLFDQNKRVVGILTGGEAVCGRSVNDYFARLSVIYDLSSLLWQQLKGWIDPAKTNLKQLNGRDPYTANWLTADTLSNISGTEVPVVTIYSSPGTGYATGFNSDSLVMYAEHFDNPSALKISEVLINIAKANSVIIADSVTIFVFSDGAVPGTVIASQKVGLNETKDNFILKADFRNTLSLTGGFYIGWKIFYLDRALSETRQFAPFHSPDRGLTGLNTAWFNDGTGWFKFTQHPSFPMSVSLDVKVVAVANSVPDKIEDTDFKPFNFRVYPNPASDYIIVASEKVFSETDLFIYDLEGVIIQTARISSKFPGEVKVDIPRLNRGIYFVMLLSPAGNEIHKILIVK